MPTLTIIAGPNGAGKSTLASTFLPGFLGVRRFVNADLIAAGLSPFDPDEAALRAGKVMIQEMDRLTEVRIDFGVETTLAGVSYVERIKRMKEIGYRVRLIFLWLPRVELCQQRVKERIQAGGHAIPPEVIERRYGRGPRNFVNRFRDLVDEWHVLENSGPQPRLLAFSVNGKTTIINEPEYATFLVAGRHDES